MAMAAARMIIIVLRQVVENRAERRGEEEDARESLTMGSNRAQKDRWGGIPRWVMRFRGLRDTCKTGF